MMDRELSRSRLCRCGTNTSPVNLAPALACLPNVNRLTVQRHDERSAAPALIVFPIMSGQRPGTSAIAAASATVRSINLAAS